MPPKRKIGELNGENGKAKQEVKRGCPSKGSAASNKNPMVLPEIIDLETYTGLARPPAMLREPVGDFSTSKASKTFPDFYDGDVVIILHSSAPEYQYRLHSSVLIRASRRFENGLKKNIPEVDPRMRSDKAGRYLARYELFYFIKSDLGPFWFPKRYPFTMLELEKKTPPAEACKKTPLINTISGHTLSSTEVESAIFAQFSKRINTAAETPLKHSRPVKIEALVISADGNGVPIQEFPFSNDIRDLADFAIQQQTVESSSVAVPKATETRGGAEPFTHSANPPHHTKVEMKTEFKQEIKQETKELQSWTVFPTSAHPGNRAQSASIVDVPVPSNNIPHKSNYTEPSTKPSSVLPTLPATPPTRVLQAYDSFFRIIYSQQPRILTDGIQSALEQSEYLMRIAIAFKMESQISAHIGNVMDQFGRCLYLAIASEPLRWFTLSLQIEHGMIYKESLIHIIGMCPEIQTELGYIKLDLKSQNLIESKYNTLKRQQYILNEKLLTFSPHLGQEYAKTGIPDKANFDTWFVVQLWRDWIRTNLAWCEDLNLPGPSRPEKYGILYKTLYHGGDGYLPFNEVQCRLYELTTGGKHSEAHVSKTKVKLSYLQRDNLARDLQILKDFATRKVEPICRNTSMLDPSDAGIDHLTCAVVDVEELPWVTPEEVMSTRETGELPKRHPLK